MTNSKLFLALISSILFAISGIAQNGNNPIVQINDCINVISGNKHGHLTSMVACDIPILITANEEDQMIGTIITGTITSYDTITITPGFKNVTISPADHSEITTNEGRIHGKTHIKIDPPPIISGRFNEFKATKNKIISPNPTNGLITINAENEIKTLFIYDLYSTLLLEKRYGKSNTEQITEDLSPFKKGLYIIKLSLENGKTITKTIIKN